MRALSTKFASLHIFTLEPTWWFAHLIFNGSIAQCITSESIGPVYSQSAKILGNISAKRGHESLMWRKYSSVD